jgi:hypothetical protein
MVGHTCNFSYLGCRGGNIASLRLALAKLVRPYLKNKIQNKKGWGLAEVIEHLLYMFEVLDSIPTTMKEGRKEGKKTVNNSFLLGVPIMMILL